MRARDRARCKAQGVRLAVVDAHRRRATARIGRRLRRSAAGDRRLGRRASACRRTSAARALLAARRRRALPRVTGLRAVISGSCSEATNAQVAQWIASGGRPSRSIRSRWRRARRRSSEALAWARAASRRGPVLVYATATPEEVKAAQQTLGVERAGAWSKQALARMAKALVAARRAQAGGGGRGDVGRRGQALGVRALAHRAADRSRRALDQPRLGAGQPIALALKSGNFGTADFFVKALEQLEHEPHVRTKPACASRSAPRPSRCSTRPHARHHRQHQRALRRRLAADAHRVEPGRLDPARLAKLDWQGRHRLRRSAVEGRASCTWRMYQERAERRRVIHLHSTHSVAVSVLDGLDPCRLLPPLTAYYVMRSARCRWCRISRRAIMALAEAVRGLAGKHHADAARQPRPGRRRHEPAAAADAIEELEATAQAVPAAAGPAPRGCSRRSRSPISRPSFPRD